MTSAVSDTFLGVTYVNCLLCHNGAGHLRRKSISGKPDHTLSGVAALIHVAYAPDSGPATSTTPVNNNIYWWSLQDNTKNYTVDYTLNTTSGNRPSRVAPAGCKSGQPCYYVPPIYLQ